ncbi:MAG: capsule assembly Wzi family protein [Bacteroidaceae bacterium]
MPNKIAIQLRRKLSLTTSFLILSAASFSQNSIIEEKLSGLTYKNDAQVSFSNKKTPLWIASNKYGLSSVKGDNGHLRLSLLRNVKCDSIHKWKIGYGIDVAGAYNYTSPIVIQQLFLDAQYKGIGISIGSKERAAEMKNEELSSGSQTFGINARPVPQVRIEIPEYISITGKSNWAAVKGHISYGMFTDDKWQKDYVVSGSRYTQKVLYHSKAGFLRLGNEKNFPLVFEGGLEMAGQFGGESHNRLPNGEVLKLGTSLKDFFNIFTLGGADPTDGIYSNVAGNTLGSWLLSLSYKFDTWKVRAYYDHFFEDHSMMFAEYGWKDGLRGIEITLPKNNFVNTFVYEYIGTKDQAGPIYHDHTDAVLDQISAIDNYYNHSIYNGWQHWGQAIGNPLFTSPLYNDKNKLSFENNRFLAHHFGINGNPRSDLHYRILVSYSESWGIYNDPYDDKKYNTSIMGEISYHPNRILNRNVSGWALSGAFAIDRGSILGNNTGFQLTISKKGILNF